MLQMSPEIPSDSKNLQPTFSYVQNFPMRERAHTGSRTCGKKYKTEVISSHCLRCDYIIHNRD